MIKKKDFYPSILISSKIQVSGNVFLIVGLSTVGSIEATEVGEGAVELIINSGFIGWGPRKFK